MLINPVGIYHGYITIVCKLLTEVPSQTNDSRLITMDISNTRDDWDSLVNVSDGGDGLVNHGARECAILYCPGTDIHVIDTVDTACFNENGGDRYLPSDFDFKIILQRATKNKYLFGTLAQCQAFELCINDFTLHLPMYKPEDQLARAINHLMIK